MSDPVWDLLQATVAWPALFNRISPDTASIPARTYYAAFARVLDQYDSMVYWTKDGPRVIKKSERDALL